MQKQIDKNFKLALLMTIMLLIVVAGGIIVILLLSYLVHGCQSDSGFWEFIYDISKAGMLIIWVVAIIIPFTEAMVIFVFALVAKKIYEKDATRLCTYRILMGFSYTGQILLACETLPKNIDFSKGGFAELGLSACLIWAIFTGMRITYTDRIKG